jgi:sphingolipid delta-4 desaturase
LGNSRLTGQKPYHLTHHKSLGVDGLDTDLPTALEAVFLDSLLGKAFFCTFQILFYAIRPVFVYKVPFTSIHFANIFAQALFDYLLVRYTSVHSLYYLILSSFLAGSLHPCAGHFIAEHYIFTPVPSSAKDPLTNTAIPETFSYYGVLNYLTYNVGLHNEHHDFPAVPWSRLWEVNRMANEFYRELPSHRSWVGVIWSFVVDEKVGMTCRVKRKEGGRMVGGASKWSQEEVEA